MMWRPQGLAQSDLWKSQLSGIVFTQAQIPQPGTQGPLRLIGKLLPHGPPRPTPCDLTAQRHPSVGLGFQICELR